MSAPCTSPYMSPAAGKSPALRANLRTAVKASALLFCALYVATLFSLRRKGGQNSLVGELLASGFSLQRAAAVVHLEQAVDTSSLLGICYKERPLLQHVQEHVCQPLKCLWVAELQVGIDLSRRALGVLPGPADYRANQCSMPRGGQRPVPAGEQPHVSFVLTMHNNAKVTAQALLELFRTSHEVPSAEFLVIDDGSTEDTGPLKQTLWRLREIFKVQVWFKRNEEPLGYGPANEQGIQLAGGKYVALINNDMFVVKGWLTAIMHTFEANPQAGMVGPLFMGAGDLITEAGGLIFEDAGASNYARGREPYPGVYFMRKTDYISAACVVFPKATYERVGGFDPQYVMGYYEDTDLAMAIRGAGLDVVFQPLAVVYHQEGTTFGTDATSELKQRLMAENKKKFFAKWQQALQEKHCPSTLDQFYSFNRASSPNLLWVDEFVPEPSRDASCARVATLLRSLLDEGYGVTLACTATGQDPQHAARLRLEGVQVMDGGTPQQWMLAHRSRCTFDIIVVAGRRAFEAAQGQIQQHCPGVPLIFDVFGLDVLQESRAAIAAQTQEQGGWSFGELAVGKVADWLERAGTEAARHTRNVELFFIDKSNVTMVGSQEAAELVRRYRPQASVAVVPSVHHEEGGGGAAAGAGLGQATCEQRMGALFIGSLDQAADRQAAEALLKEVLPVLVRELPEGLRGSGFKLHVAAAGGTQEVPENMLHLFKENEEHVAFHGSLSDAELADLRTQARVAVAPILSGAGALSEVGQAMQQGLPVVVSPVAAEWFLGQEGTNCLIASSAEEFARKVLQLHADCALWRRLADGAASTLRDHFSAEGARGAFLEALSSLGRGPRPKSERGVCRLPDT